MSFPDDETRDPQDNLQPEESEAGVPDDSMGLDDEFAEEALFGSEMPGFDDMPAVADDDGVEMSVAPADGLDETVEFAAPADTESGLAFQAMGMDEETADVAAADESAEVAEGDETLDFAAPADTESGIAFQAMGMEEESAEGGEGAEFLAGIAEDLGDFGIEKAEDEAAAVEGIDTTDDEEKEPAESRGKKILAAMAGTDPYTVLMGIALVALMCGVLFFYLELSSYDFDIMAEKAKQLVGTLSLGWLF